MNFTKELVDEYADSLLIGLTSEENKMVLDEMDEINKTVSIVEKIPNIEDIEPMTHTLDNFDYVLREDIIEESIDIRDIQSNCDDVEGRETQVPKVVG